jgi:ribosomal protein RSM22 (predicted rRNA methylase)
MTVPKSQGKQQYYDARKSSWGDIFPHEPKNPPQVRYNSAKVERNLDKNT